MCVIASGLQLVIWAFSPGGWSLHLLSHLNSSLWSFHSWHIRLWLLKTRHPSSIILFSCSRNAGPWATRSPQGSWKIICSSVVVDEFLACLGIAYNCLDNMSTYSQFVSLLSSQSLSVHFPVFENHNRSFWSHPTPIQAHPLFNFTLRFVNGQRERVILSDGRALKIEYRPSCREKGYNHGGTKLVWGLGFGV